MGGGRKGSVRDDSGVSCLSHQQMLLPLSVIKKTEEGRVAEQCSALDVSIEMPVRRPNGCVKEAIG